MLLKGVMTAGTPPSVHQSLALRTKVLTYHLNKGPEETQFMSDIKCELQPLLIY
jgi:hypothetical protein